jgi:hypothetical protein
MVLKRTFVNESVLFFGLVRVYIGNGRFEHSDLHIAADLYQHGVIINGMKYTDDPGGGYDLIAFFHGFDLLLDLLLFLALGTDDEKVKDYEYPSQKYQIYDTGIGIVRITAHQGKGKIQHKNELNFGVSIAPKNTIF